MINEFSPNEKKVSDYLIIFFANLFITFRDNFLVLFEILRMFKDLSTPEIHEKANILREMYELNIYKKIIPRNTKDPSIQRSLYCFSEGRHTVSIVHL